MKKSQKNKKLEDLNPEDLNPEELIKDAESIFSFIDNFESLDLEKVNLDKLQKDINKLQKSLKDKYSDYIDDENLEDNLDTEE